ncbi:hypothetical protein [Bradyrhizobium sp. AS23.2]|uniref:hypothetical protein n=1 Tax=Bradyrhizobium sp. AS23.2 TaxID=1680155 RepID=UPI0009395AEB|nr:hypothetical protein [Bradyrhizobium sp. AS23.2]OKO86826.1 hypothetical protein AC630_01915 [Bradyrhizobium sp. AS23.2]
MWSDDDRGELERLLHRIGIPADQIEIKIVELEEAKLSFRCRCERRANSPQISAVVSQLGALADAAERVCSGHKASIPDQILSETYDALVGRYPFSNVDMAAVTLETFRNPEAIASSYRKAVVNASVEPHVVNAAMRQLPDEPHLVAVRSMPFPFAAADAYFFGNLPEPKAANLRQRLEDFIAGMPKEASSVLRQVHEAVRRATRDPAQENTGRRTLYDWAEPVPVARLAIDVFQVVLEPAVERPRTAVQALLAQMIDVLIDDQNSDRLRQDVLGSMLTIWVAINQHRLVAQRLSGILDGRSERAETPRERRRRDLWLACHEAVISSSAELLRRAHMGDFHHVNQVRSDPRAPGEKGAMVIATKTRATGLPVPTIDLGPTSQAKTDALFLVKLARACKPWLRSG